MGPRPTPPSSGHRPSALLPRPAYGFGPVATTVPPSDGSGLGCPLFMPDASDLRYLPAFGVTVLFALWPATLGSSLCHWSAGGLARRGCIVNKAEPCTNDVPASRIALSESPKHNVI
jgi:hypothetical protein